MKWEIGRGEKKMKGKKIGILKRKMFVIEAAVLIMFASILLPMVTTQNKAIKTQKEIFCTQQSLGKTDEKEYCIAFGPMGAKNADDLTVIKKMNETTFLNFKYETEELKNRHLSSNEIIDQQLQIYIKYGITPECFTLKNLTEAMEDLKTTDKSRDIPNGAPWLGKLTIGPHMIIYCSLFSAVVNFQPAGNFVAPKPYSDINKIVDIFNISKNSSLYKLLYNVTVFHYLQYAPLEVLIGGALGYYLSLGLFPGLPSYSILQNPFIGVYIFWFGCGIYIYEGHDKWGQGVDNAILDFFIGLCLYSMVMYREFSEPTP